MFKKREGNPPTRRRMNNFEVEEELPVFGLSPITNKTPMNPWDVNQTSFNSPNDCKLF